MAFFRKEEKSCLMLENRKWEASEALFCTWPCLALEPFQVINMHYSYVIFPLTVGVLRAFQAMVKTVHNWNFSKYNGNLSHR